MNELDKKAFEDAYSRVKASETLRADTLSKMLEENSKVKPARQVKNLFCRGALAAALCAAALCFILLRPSGVSFITPMEDDVYYDEVELKDGAIHFVKNRVAISISPNAGTVTIGKENRQETDKNKEEASETAEETITESGGRISFRKTDALTLPEIAEENWSYIGEQKIYVTVLEANEVRYQAVFEKDEAVYEMTGVNVSQKEFIEELYLRVKESFD